jgi:hypothetical protein
MSWRRALELAADSREAAPRQGVRWRSTTNVSFESLLGARRETSQAGGGSQPEERHGMAAEVLRIDRRQNNSVRTVIHKYYRT